MACKAGYPQLPCPFQMRAGAQKVTREACGPCREYEPPKHILTWCALWEVEKILCMKPKSACETCEFKVDRLVLSPDDIRANHTDAVNKWKADNKDKVDEWKQRWREQNRGYSLEYMKKYRKDNREKLRLYIKDYMRRRRAKEKTE